MYIHRPISPALSPNTDAEDVAAAFAMILTPWRWFDEGIVARAETALSGYVGKRGAVAFGSGRAALTALLGAYGIGAGDEVIVQAFSCTVVPNAVRFAGAVPVYADVDATFNIDPVSFGKRISGKTRAVIVQHTFGIPADIGAIANIARKHGIVVIEDMAHGLGAARGGKRLGSFGDAAFFSFGRDKAVSSVSGGAAVSDDDAVNRKLRQIRDRAAVRLSAFAVFRELLHPVAFSVILPLYGIGVGKVILVALQKLGLLSLPVAACEKAGERPVGYMARYAGALASLLLVQFAKLDRLVNGRRAAARIYAEALKDERGITAGPFVDGASYLRYPVLLDTPDAARSAARGRGIFLGTWYSNLLDPVGSDLHAAGYRAGDCPNAEAAAKRILNLPTNVTRDEAHAVLAALTGKGRR